MKIKFLLLICLISFYFSIGTSKRLFSSKSVKKRSFSTKKNTKISKKKHNSSGQLGNEGVTKGEVVCFVPSRNIDDGGSTSCHTVVECIDTYIPRVGWRTVCKSRILCV